MSKIIKVKAPMSWLEAFTVADMYGSVRVEVNGKVYEIIPVEEDIDNA